MNSYGFIAFLFIFSVVLIPECSEAAKKSKKKKKDGLFDPDVLKCLVCQSVAEEIDAAIFKIDPKKMVETGGFRIDDMGRQKKTSVPYARSQVHLMELTEKVCDNFEDYAQAKEKKTGKPTIIRLTTPSGNMNPKFSEVDVVPDEDLNKKLKFYCEAIVEDLEDDIVEVYAEKGAEKMGKELCYQRSKFCSNKKSKTEL